MDSRIFSDGQRPSVGWAARDTPRSARTPPLTSRLPPSTALEDPRCEDAAPTARPPATPTPNLSSTEYFLTPESDHPPVFSPDPITPGDVFDSSVSQRSPSLLTRLKSPAQHSAPAEMGRPHDRLSISDSLQSTGTWDEVKKRRLEAQEQGKVNREETLEGIGEETLPKDDQEEVTVDEEPQREKGGSRQRPAPKSAHTAPSLKTPAALEGMTPLDPVSEQQTHVDGVLVPPGDSTPAGGAPGSRVGGWGTPFKVQWIRTDPLSFHRTKHLKNPWNNDVRLQSPSHFCC
jgi:hypothetical protein